MRFPIHLAVLVLATAFAQSALTAAHRPAQAAPKKALCAVCSVREGAGPEEVQATAKHQGRRYSFCSTACRDEFLKNPDEFVKAQPAEQHDHKSAPEGGQSTAPS